MRIAAIDLGTNTFHLLIAEKSSANSVRFICRKTCVVKLGREGFDKDRISDVAFERGITAMKAFRPLLKKFAPKKTIALATSAIRNCKNGSSFIRQAEKIIGAKIEVITGEREAELIYHGVKNAYPLSNTPVLIMDIGGGSIEFIIANKFRIFWKKSIEAGAARLANKFSPSNPINKSELSAINDYLKQVFSPVLQAVKKYRLEILIGSSGSFDSFALIMGIKNENTAVEISIKKYAALHEKLVRSTKKERLSMKGLQRMRVDMIVLASVCSAFILNKTGMRKLYRSSYALKEGIVFSE